MCQRSGWADVGDDGTVVTWAWPSYARFVALRSVVTMIPNKLSNEQNFCVLMGEA